MTSGPKILDGCNSLNSLDVGKRTNQPCIRDKDRITWVELFGILKFHVEMEDEIESFIEGANRKGDAR